MEPLLLSILSGIDLILLRDFRHLSYELKQYGDNLYVFL